MGTTTYYFDSHSASEWTNPDNMDDGNTATYATCTADSKIHTFDGNTVASRPGAITKVEIRWYRKGSIAGGFYRKCTFTPVFSGGNGDFHWDQSFTTGGSWSSYHDITADTNAPSWTYAALQALTGLIVSFNAFEDFTLYVSKVEIRVTHDVKELTETISSSALIDNITGAPVYYYQPSETSQFTLERADVLEFSGIEQEDSLLRNDIIVIGNGVSASTSDSTSITTYGRYRYRYENTNISDSNDCATLASQILSNYKDPKEKGQVKISGKTGVNTRDKFTLNLPDVGISNEVYEIVQYIHQIDGKGFYTTVYFGETPWDMTREVAALLKEVY